MFGPDTPKIVSRFYEIIAAVESALSGRFRLQHRQAPGERALFFVHEDGKPFLYVGAWYEPWSRGGFPLWYGVHEQWDTATVQRFLERHPGALPFEGYRLCRMDCAPVFEDGPVDPVIELIESELVFLTQV